MIENLPNYISIVFGLTTLVTFLLFFHVLKKSNAGSKAPLIGIVMIIWLAFQMGMSSSLYYLNTAGDMPPKFTVLGFIPAFIGMILLFNTKKGQLFIDSLSMAKLTMISIVRIPVEVVLFWLFIHDTIPELLTFEGTNFDIFAGITAPIIYYAGFIKGKLTTKTILAWNIISLLLLLNIVITATLSFPTAFQYLSLDKPNLGILYFPFFWLPSFIVPIVFFSHVVSIRQLVRKISISG